MPELLVNFWAFGALAAVLVVASVTDVRNGRIYNWLTYPAIAAGLIGHTLVSGVGSPTGHVADLGLIGSALGMAVGGALLLAWLAGGIGGGDAKLMVAVGALTGWRFTLEAMFWGFVVAAVMAVAVMLHRKVARRTLARIGRFLVLLFTPGRPASPATEDSPKIPFGLALCIGSGVALVLALFRSPGAGSLILGI